MPHPRTSSEPNVLHDIPLPVTFRHNEELHGVGCHVIPLHSDRLRKILISLLQEQRLYLFEVNVAFVTQKHIQELSLPLHAVHNFVLSWKAPDGDLARWFVDHHGLVQDEDLHPIRVGYGLIPRHSAIQVAVVDGLGQGHGSSGRSGGHDAKETAEDGSREISVENNSYGNMFGLLLRQRQSMLI